MDISDKVGIKFKERMSGLFCEGVSDPIAGYNYGKMKGRKISFKVEIEIPCLKRFIEEPNYCAKMSGKVSADLIGDNMEMKNGVFNIRPGEAGSGMRHVIYKFGFNAQDGKPYFFSGVKNIPEDRSVRSSADPITLYSTIYRGESEDGEIYGAGILLFNTFKDGLKFFLSFRYPGAGSLAEKISALKALSRHTTP